MKKVLAFLLAIILVLSLCPFGAVSAASGTMSLDELRAKYPDGAYWNHKGTTNNPGGYTWNPCKHHNGCSYNGSCGCNAYDGVAIQCLGFAYQLASLAYDCDPRNEWTSNYNLSAVNKLKAGDIVRYKYNSHSIFVIGVDGDTVTYADCNSDLHCQIKWDQTVTKSELKASFAYVKAAPKALSTKPKTPELTIRFNANGGTIDDGEVIGTRYTVTDMDGVNMRSGAGTSNQVLTVLPVNTSFSVKTGKTKSANGYIWGRTTVNGITGWVVISDFVKKTGSLRDGDYYLNKSLVYKAADESVLTQTMTYGKTTSGGLRNASTMGIEREGYRFAGWSRSADGSSTVFDQDNSKLKPETIYPKLKEGSHTITLYAIWKCIHRYSIACDTSCNNCGALRMITHEYTDACDKECNVCGAERTPPHNWEKGVCTGCNKKSKPPKITAQPKTGYAKMGKQVAVSVSATGDGLTYQWFYKNAGSKTYYRSSIKSSIYYTTMNEKSKDRRVLCYVYDKYGNQVQSKSVYLREAASVTTQPKTTYAPMGEKVSVSIAASGDGLTYQWYTKNAGDTAYHRSSIKTANYVTTMSAKSKDRRIRCEVYDKYGNMVQSKTVILRESVSVTAQPKTVTVKKDKKATTTVKATGDGLRYVWYVKNTGSKKFVKSAITTATYSVTMTAKVKDRQVLCYVYDKYGNRVKSETVVLKMK